MKYINKKSLESRLRAEKLEQWKRNFALKYPSIEISYRGFIKEALSGYGRKELQFDLWEEQKFICCYCGQWIPNPKEESGRITFEHIVTQSEDPTRTLDFTNILMSCKGQKSTTIEKGETLGDVATRVDVSENDIRKFTDTLIEKEGATVFLARPKHCNIKRGNDVRKIIDPTDIQYSTSETDCWRLFQYDFDGDKFECTIIPKEGVHKKLTQDTCDVLGLNSQPLKIMRARLYENFEETVLFLEDEDGNRLRARTKTEISTYLESCLKDTYAFCSMDYSIISEKI